MFEDELFRDSSSDKISKKLDDVLQKLDQSIVQYALLVKEAEDLTKRRQVVSTQLDDVRREIERLQESRIDLVVDMARLKPAEVDSHVNPLV